MGKFWGYLILFFVIGCNISDSNLNSRPSSGEDTLKISQNNENEKPTSYSQHTPTQIEEKDKKPKPTPKPSPTVTPTPSPSISPPDNEENICQSNHNSSKCRLKKTENVDVLITGGNLTKPVQYTVTQKQFIDNNVVLKVDNLLPGRIEIQFTFKDKKGNILDTSQGFGEVMANKTVMVYLYGEEDKKEKEKKGGDEEKK